MCKDNENKKELPMVFIDVPNIELLHISKFWSYKDVHFIQRKDVKIEENMDSFTHTKA